MKKLLLIAIALISFSCTTDDTQSLKKGETDHKFRTEYVGEEVNIGEEINVYLERDKNNNPVGDSVKITIVCKEYNNTYGTYSGCGVDNLGRKWAFQQRIRVDGSSMYTGFINATCSC